MRAGVHSRDGQLPVGQRERGLHMQIPGGEGRQPAFLVAEPYGQVLNRPAGPAQQTVAGDPQGERQLPAQLADPLHRGGFGGCPARADDRGDQFGRLRCGQGRQRQPVHVLQPRQRPAAGDHDHAGAPRGQQRAHLKLVCRVVEHHEAAPSAQRSPVEFRTLGLSRGDPVLGDAQCLEQPRQGFGWVKRLRVHALQVHEELAIGAITGQKPGGVGGKGRLAQPSRSRDHGDDRGPGRVALPDQGPQPGHFCRPPVKSVMSRGSSQYPAAREAGISRAAAAAFSSARSSSGSSPKASMIAFSVRRCGLRLYPVPCR